MGQHSEIFIEEREHDIDPDILRQQEEEMNAAYDEIRPIQAMNVFEGLTKSKVKELAKIAVESVLHSGNPLTVAESISVMENFIKEIKDSPEFKNYVREEAAKYKGGFSSTSGAKIELAETGTTYNFEKCGDPLLIELEESLKTVTDDVKARKEFLKTVPQKGIEVRFGDELVTVYPPSKTSCSSYKVTLSK